MTLSARRLKTLRALARRRGRERHGLFVVEGRRLVDELVASDLEIVECLVSEPGLAGELPHHVVSAELLAELADTVTPQGVLAIARTPPSTPPAENARRVLVLDRVADPGNAGTLLRAALGFGVDHVVLTSGCVEATNPKLVRASMGALFGLPLQTNAALDDVLETLVAQGVTPLLACPRGGTDPRSAPVPDRWALVLGAEADGLPAALAGRRLSLPLDPRCESLNVAMAGTVLLWELGRGTSTSTSF